MTFFWTKRHWGWRPRAIETNRLEPRGRRRPGSPCLVGHRNRYRKTMCFFRPISTFPPGKLGFRTQQTRKTRQQPQGRLPAGWCHKMFGQNAQGTCVVMYNPSSFFQKRTTIDQKLYTSTAVNALLNWQRRGQDWSKPTKEHKDLTAIHWNSHYTKTVINWLRL